MANIFGAIIGAIIAAFTVRAWVMELRERLYR